jgi:hypothetical protein
MFTWKGKLATALLLLAGVGVCLQAGASGSGKKEKPAAKGQEAALEQAWNDWRMMERQQIRDHRETRQALAECKKQIVQAQQKLQKTQAQLLRLHDRLNDILRTVARPDQDSFIKQLHAEVKELENTKLQRKDRMEQAEKKYLDAEEALQVLEREQALRRDLMRTRIEAAEARLHPRASSEQGWGQRIERRLEEMDRKLERLEGELSKLRRQLETRNPKTGP